MDTPFVGIQAEAIAMPKRKRLKTLASVYSARANERENVADGGQDFPRWRAGSEPGASLATRRVTQQPVLLCLHRGITLARGPVQAIEIDDFDVPAAVANVFQLLHRAGHDRNAVAARANHLCRQLLGQAEALAAG